jgi:hypothetical protein
MAAAAVMMPPKQPGLDDLFADDMGLDESALCVL